MNKQERILAAINGSKVDVLPYSMWYHFGTQFMPGEKAAEVVVAFYERYDLDFLKVMNDYAYPLPEGLDRVRSINDWKRMKPVKPTEGGFAEQLNGAGNVFGNVPYSSTAGDNYMYIYTDINLCVHTYIHTYT